MADPYTLVPADLDPTASDSGAQTVYAPARQASFTAAMLRTLKASPLRLYSWGRGNLPRRLIDVFAGELELLSRTVADVATRAITESTYRAWQHPTLFPPRGGRTLARGQVRVAFAGPLTAAQVVPAGTLFGSPDGRTVRSEVAVTAGIGATSLLVPVVSETPGVAGNFLAGEITTMLSGARALLVGNPAAITGGREAESEGEMRVRFQDFVESRATASRLTLYSAVMNTQITDPGDASMQQRPLDAALILPWLLPDLNTEMAYGYVVIDGGGGSATPELLAAAQAKVSRLEAAGDTFSVIAVNPWVVTLNVRVSATRTANLPAVGTALQQAWADLAATRLIEDGRGRGRLAIFDVIAALEACHPDIVAVQITDHDSSDLQPPVGARLIAGVLTAEILPGGIL